MSRLKTFFLYALAIAAFWLLSDFLIYMAVNGTYQAVNVPSSIASDGMQVNVTDSKATSINGYVKGNIYNNSGTTINKKYLKIDCYSPRNVLMGTKYVTIDNLEPGKSQNFEMWHKYKDVKDCKLSITDSIQNATQEQFLSQEVGYYLVIGTLALMFMI